MDFSETIVVYDLKLATDDRSDKKFLLTSKLCPLGSVCPLPRGYISVLTHEKKCIKSDFKEISLKLPVPVDIKISSPRGCQPLPRGYMYIHV